MKMEFSQRLWLQGKPVMEIGVSITVGLMADNTMSDFGEFTKPRSVKSMVKYTREIEYSDILDSLLDC